MDGKTMQQIRDSLLSRWKKIGTHQQREAQAQMTHELAHPAEMIEMAQTLEQIERDTSLHEVERRELVAIERALAKMATGSYGKCEDCGEEILVKRLMVLPEARLCAGCQASEERHQSRTRLAGYQIRGE